LTDRVTIYPSCDVILAVILAVPLLVLTLKVLVALPVPSETVLTGVIVPNIGSSIVNMTEAPVMDPSDEFDTITVMVV
jgi:hypothetical protein